MTGGRRLGRGRRREHALLRRRGARPNRRTGRPSARSAERRRGRRDRGSRGKDGFARGNGSATGGAWHFVVELALSALGADTANHGLATERGCVRARDALAGSGSGPSVWPNLGGSVGRRVAFGSWPAERRSRFGEAYCEADLRGG
jgi:hypothetical protein